jgi:hypothetical protein
MIWSYIENFRFLDAVSAGVDMVPVPCSSLVDGVDIEMR